MWLTSYKYFSLIKTENSLNKRKPIGQVNIIGNIDYILAHIYSTLLRATVFLFFS